jgi:hypothetical protein
MEIIADQQFGLLSIAAMGSETVQAAGKMPRFS